MKKHITTALLTMVAASVFSGGQQETNSNNKYEFQLNDFTGINASGAFDIEVKKSDQYSVIVIAGKSLKNKLIVEKQNDDLYLGIKPFGVSFNTKSPKVIITMPELKQIQLSGASSMIVTGFQSYNDISADLRGASSLNINMITGNFNSSLSGSSELSGVLEATDVRITLTGSSGINLNGSGKKLIIDCAGSSSGSLKNFSVKDADILLKGSSKLHINLNGILNLTASGSSKLFYNGKLIMGDINLLGAASIKQE